MSRVKVHFSRIREIKGRTITGTLCNRMVCDGEINCTDDCAEVTCRFCLGALDKRVAA